MGLHMQLFETIAHLFHPRRSNNHRARLLHPDSIFSLLLIVVGFGLAIHNLNLVSKDLGSILGYASDIQVGQVVTLTNAERTKGGLGTVQLNETLSSAARAKAADMFEKQYWAHVSTTGKQPWDFMKEAGYSFSAAGENLARDFSTTPEMISAWMGSPTHRANIMNGTYTEIGVAVVNGNLEGIDTTLVVQMFGKPPGAKPAVTAEASETVVTQVATKARTTETATVAPAAVVPTKVRPTPTPTILVFGETPVQVPAGSPSVLSDISVTVGSLYPEQISPLDIMKPVFLSILLMIILTLAYDAHMFERKNTFRVVGRNLAHILYLAVIAGIIVVFTSGVIK